MLRTGRSPLGCPQDAGSSGPHYSTAARPDAAPRAPFSPAGRADASVMSAASAWVGFLSCMHDKPVRGVALARRLPHQSDGLRNAGSLHRTRRPQRKRHETGRRPSCRPFPADPPAGCRGVRRTCQRPLTRHHGHSEPTDAEPGSRHLARPHFRYPLSRGTVSALGDALNSPVATFPARHTSRARSRSGPLSGTDGSRPPNRAAQRPAPALSTPRLAIGSTPSTGQSPARTARYRPA